MLQPKYKELSIYLLLLVCLYFVFFQHLDSYHILNWDESMFAVNACEMAENHNYIVPYFNHMPDMMVLKPPMQTWLQFIFIKLIGYTELAVRLPSALASCGSALVLFVFIRKRSSLVFALCVFFVFITSYGVASFHTGRTGDADAVLAFFILCYSTSFYKWLFEDNSVSLFYFFIFLSLAFLTKSFVALFFAPALLVSIIYFKKMNVLFKSKWFYIGLLLFITTSIGYLFLRNLYSPGYLNNLIFGDFLSRYSSFLDLHQEPFDFYFINFYETRFRWILLMLPGALLMYFNADLRFALVFILLLFISYFLIISSSQTKLFWYDLPLYPMLSILSGYTIYVLILKFNSIQKPIINAALLCFVFLIPFYFAVRNSSKNEIEPGVKKLEVLNEYAYRNKNNNSLNGVVFYTGLYERSLYFYKYKLNHKGLDFKIINTIDSLQENSIVIVAEDSLKKLLFSKYKANVIEEYKTVLKVKI